MGMHNLALDQRRKDLYWLLAVLRQLIVTWKKVHWWLWLRER